MGDELGKPGFCGQRQLDKLIAADSLLISPFVHAVL
ncbi:hypothetical protein RSal33209_1991 [Renibacterium salmoninarum ATCC 33209]|uniref:Uncharacterized protein n=1 Tax=Renibacterium salmoninarum (strain ATCC 33209 / DSM 20767 / JCM 11484 / NBRC 15589 / NCIMB 2235) TaxID=288705 RepID=A9WSD6_RENSM|nr:hypothetical protein RSal33209_1991 [Renibacterium salmoninarum ATCC 33209]